MRTKVIKARSGKYTDKAGNEKTSYITVGHLIEANGSEKIKIDSLPINFDGWLFFAELPQAGIPASQGGIPAYRHGEPNDDIPF